MIDRASLKQSAKDKLKGQWGTGALITLIYVLITGLFGGLSNIKNGSAIFSLASLFINAPLTLGLSITYIVLARTGSLVFENLFSGFRAFPKSLGMYFWMILWIIVWLLAFIVPGIVKALSYSQAFYIIAENPNVRVRDAMKISMKMTDGYKGDIFVMLLSFLGWALLSIVTLGIGLLWLIPYIHASLANMYLRLRELSIESGTCSEEMFSGTVTLVQ